MKEKIGEEKVRLIPILRCIVAADRFVLACNYSRGRYFEKISKKEIWLGES